MAEEVPCRLEGLPEPDQKKSSCTYWTFLVLNVVFPACEGVAYIWLWTTLYINNKKESDGLEIYFFNASVIGTGVLEIISGVLLIQSVGKIRAFFKERDAEDLIDTKVLLLHASAFGIYLVSVLVFYSATLLHFIYQQD